MDARIRRACVFVATAGFMLSSTPARATEWCAPVESGGIITPYGAECPSGTHRGIDLSGVADARVLAPLPGTVVFSGQVPADGGGTCGAITLELSDGRRLSLLPLSDTSVSTGDAVVPGDVIGALAGAGDDSTGEPHLHVGLRSGTCYLDPSGLVRVSVPVDPPLPPIAPGSGFSSGTDPTATTGDMGATDTATVPRGATVVGSQPHVAVAPTTIVADGSVAAARAVDLAPAPAVTRGVPHLTVAAGGASARSGVLIGAAATVGTGAAVSAPAPTLEDLGADEAGPPIATTTRARAAGLATLAAGIGVGSRSLLTAAIMGLLAMAVAVPLRRGAAAGIR